MWAALIGWLLMAPLTNDPLPWAPARAPHPTDRGYIAVCEPMRCCGTKMPHPSWLGEWHLDKESAQAEADEHNRQFPDHDARLRSLKN